MLLTSCHCGLLQERCRRFLCSEGADAAAAQQGDAGFGKSGRGDLFYPYTLDRTTLSRDSSSASTWCLLWTWSVAQASTILPLSKAWCWDPACDLSHAHNSIACHRRWSHGREVAKVESSDVPRSRHRHGRLLRYDHDPCTRIFVPQLCLCNTTSIVLQLPLHYAPWHSS